MSALTALLNRLPKKIMTVILLIFAQLNASAQTATARTLGKNNANIVIFYQDSMAYHKKLVTNLNRQLKIKMPAKRFQFVNITPLNKNKISATINPMAPCVMTIGSLATNKVLSVRKPVKHLSLLVARHQLDKLNRIYTKLGIGVTGIYDEQPFIRQLYLSKALNPDLKDIAIILDQTDKFYLSEYQSIAKNNQINLNYRILKPADSPEKYLKKIATDETYLLVTNNRQLSSKSKLAALILSAYYQQIKVIGNRHENVKAGTIASVYTPEIMLANEASQLFKKVCLSGKIPPPGYALNFNVMTNRRMAENMSIILPEPAVLRQQIIKMERKQVTNNE